MKKLQLLACALLFAGVASAQTQGPRPCVDCEPVTVDGSASVRPGANNNAALSRLADNCSELVQAGDFNYATVSQNGTDNDAELTQIGSRNDAYQIQSGALHQAGIRTVGNDNYAYQEQSGTNHEALIEQDGSRNYAYQRQSGSGTSISDAYIDQDGDNHFAIQLQSGGNDNSARTFQGESGRTGYGQASCITQTGNSNEADVRQDHP